MGTPFTELVGCRQPIQLAPMGGGIGTPALAAAVCEAGGLGMLSSFGPMPVAAQIDDMTRRTTQPYGVGFFGFDLPNRTADLELASSRCRVVDVFWGEPDREVVERIHQGGALAFWQVGSASEASAAADAGCDVVVVQGVEAGGHVRGTTPLLALLDEVVPALEIPVVAAGGITTVKHVRAALDTGASGVRVGTRLLATFESAAHAAYLAALVDAQGEADTELTTAFHVGWEDAPHRVLRSAIPAAAGAAEPIATVMLEGRPVEVGRWWSLPPTSSCDGNVTAMAMYAGAGVGDVTEILSVRGAVRLLMGELT